MQNPDFSLLTAEVSALSSHSIFGVVTGLSRGLVQVRGLDQFACIGDRLTLISRSGQRVGAEILSLAPHDVLCLPEGSLQGFALGDKVLYHGQSLLYPSEDWVGRVLDPFGEPYDGSKILRGSIPYALRSSPPEAISRKKLGERLETGLPAFNTFLPIVRGQRLGLFAGSGVGKSTLLGKLARSVSSDVAVIALIGERGREVREFVENVLGSSGMKRSIVVAATSDQSPLLKRRAAWTAMAIAEYFRDLGAHVLFLADSVTRFAEAHREVALSAGEAASMRGFPPSTSQMIMDLAERAGPGVTDSGDITAILSVLVAGSDMEEPIADIMRGVLDGHVVLDRSIAERGRFPAVDVLRSVSRSLPEAATDEENDTLQRARALMGAYDEARLMVQSGLYSPGSDPTLDQAIRAHDKLERFLGRVDNSTVEESFAALSQCLPR